MLTTQYQLERRRSKTRGYTLSPLPLLGAGRAEAVAPTAVPPLDAPMCTAPSASAAAGSAEPHRNQTLELPSLVDTHLAFSAHTAPSCSHVLMLEALLSGKASKEGPVWAVATHVPPQSPTVPRVPSSLGPRGCISAG